MKSQDTLLYAVGALGVFFYLKNKDKLDSQIQAVAQPVLDVAQPLTDKAQPVTNLASSIFTPFTNVVKAVAAPAIVATNTFTAPLVTATTQISQQLVPSLAPISEPDNYIRYAEYTGFLPIEIIPRYYDQLSNQEKEIVNSIRKNKMDFSNLDFPNSNPKYFYLRDATRAAYSKYA